MLSYTRYPELKFTWFVSTGETTIENWLQTVSAYRQEGVTTHELYDLTRQTNLFRNEEIEKILNFTNSHKALRPSAGKTALLAADPTRFGIARMYEIQAELMMEDWHVQVFDSIESASNWLGNDVAVFIAETPI